MLPPSDPPAPETSGLAPDVPGPRALVWLGAALLLVVLLFAAFALGVFAAERGLTRPVLPPWPEPPGTPQPALSPLPSPPASAAPPVVAEAHLAGHGVEVRPWLRYKLPSESAQAGVPGSGSSPPLSTADCRSA